jgi:3-ketosteroid 9alpha-monooxygenase subunit B
VIRETPDAATFVFAADGTRGPAFVYQAGQFITLLLEIGGRPVRRCYSLSSAPGIDADSAITVKRTRNGLVSNWLNDHIQAGDRLRALPPSGHFLLPHEPLPLCFYAAGSGITPVISLIKAALAHRSVPVRLFYANRDRQSAIFAHQLSAMLETHHDRFAVRWHFDDRDGPVTGANLAERSGRPSDAAHYLCGPGPFMALAEATLLDAGAAAERILSERFLSPDNPADHLLPRDTGTGIAADLTIILGGRRHEIHCGAGETILEAARAAGLDPPSACEQGSCGSCIAKVATGHAAMRHNDILTADEIAEGLVLTCQTEPRSERLVVEF